MKRNDGAAIETNNHGTAIAMRVYVVYNYSYQASVIIIIIIITDVRIAMTAAI